MNIHPDLSDDDLSSALGTETLLPHDLVPEGLTNLSKEACRTADSPSWGRSKVPGSRLKHESAPQLQGVTGRGRCITRPFRLAVSNQARDRGRAGRPVGITAGYKSKETIFSDHQPTICTPGHELRLVGLRSWVPCGRCRFHPRPLMCCTLARTALGPF
jgi:hypothetical protein